MGQFTVPSFTEFLNEGKKNDVIGTYQVLQDFEVFDNIPETDNDWAASIIGKGSMIEVSEADMFDGYAIKVTKYKKGKLSKGNNHAKLGSTYYVWPEDVTENKGLKQIK